MKIMPLSYELCQQLLKMGYTHFVIKYDHDKSDYCVPKRIVTYEAIQSNLPALAGSIEYIMYLPENKIIQYYVMFHDLSKLARDYSCRSLVVYDTMCSAF
jgi:hypothetical protein